MKWCESWTVKSSMACYPVVQHQIQTLGFEEGQHLKENRLSSPPVLIGFTKVNLLEHKLKRISTVLEKIMLQTTVILFTSQCVQCIAL